MAEIVIGILLIIAVAVLIWKMFKDDMIRVDREYGYEFSGIAEKEYYECGVILAKNEKEARQKLKTVLRPESYKSYYLHIQDIVVFGGNDRCVIGLKADHKVEDPENG